MPKLEIKAYPAPRYADRIQFCRFRRTPDSDIYEARVRLPDGRWTKWFSLGTRDLEEAKVEAVEQLAKRQQLHDSGLPQPARAAPPRPAENTFREIAQEVLRDLKAQRDEAIRHHGKGSGKVNTLAVHIAAIENRLVPAFGDTPVPDLTRARLNTWARAEKVEARRGPQKGRMVTPGQSTIGSWNHALQKVLDRAVEKGVIVEDNKPAISQKGFGKAVPEPPLWRPDVAALRDHMTDDWVEAGGRREWDQEASVEVRRLLRAYVALGTCTGIRPGEEMELILSRQVNFETVGGKPTIRIPILAHQGKYGVERTAFAYMNDVFDVEGILRDLIRWREKRWTCADRKPKDSPLFALPSTGRCPNFAPPFKKLLREIGILADPKTGLDRVPYSMRHYYGTQAILRRRTYEELSKVMGTSPGMLRRHYDHAEIIAHAADLSGHGERDAAERALAVARRRAAQDRAHGIPPLPDPVTGPDRQPEIEHDRIDGWWVGLDH